MSSGDLQEMEVSTKQSKTAVNAGAKPAEPMPKMADPELNLVLLEDLGGPTPENYKPDNDSAKFKDPSSHLGSKSKILSQREQNMTQCQPWIRKMLCQKK